MKNLINKEETAIIETVIDGYTVKMRFNSSGNAKILPAVQATLISAYFNSVFSEEWEGK